MGWARDGWQDWRWLSCSQDRTQRWGRYFTPGVHKHRCKGHRQARNAEESLKDGQHVQGVKYCAHTLTHIHTTHTQTHMHNTCSHTLIQHTRSYIQMHTHSHAQTYSHVTHMFTHTHSYTIHPCSHTQLHTHTRPTHTQQQHCRELQTWGQDTGRVALPGRNTRMLFPALDMSRREARVLKAQRNRGKTMKCLNQLVCGTSQSAQSLPLGQ